ncbi:hypothetical protein HanIR_Chr12g0588561 [Helianthus annuus]|nr:hypothetical protein HanIR_Chr12g0588561 [Helianthus annuus]
MGIYSRQEREETTSFFCLSFFSLSDLQNFFQIFRDFAADLQVFLEQIFKFPRNSKIFDLLLFVLYSWLKKGLNMKKVSSLSSSGIRGYLSKSLKVSGFHRSGMHGILVRTRRPPMHRRGTSHFLKTSFYKTFGCKNQAATKFMAHILHYYGFHISKMSPPGMVRVRHFEFLCRSHDIEPTVERFKAFYQLIRNMGFYSFGNQGSTKKILLNPPKSFHDWKQKFFFIREEVIPIAMIFRALDTIEKEELPITKGEARYLKLTATPNRIFCESVLVAAQMSHQWLEDSNEVPVLKFQDREAHLYQAAFPTFDGSMGVRPLESGKHYWYERIKGHFLFPLAGAFANPPTSTKGVHLPNPRPLRAVTSAGKEILYLSSKESIWSSNGELSSWSNIFAGVLRDLGIDPEEKKKKPKKKKVITIDAEVTSKKSGSSRATAGTSDKGTLQFRQNNLEDYVVASDSLESLSCIGEKKTGAAGSNSLGNAGLRNPDAVATPSSIALDEEEEEEEEVEEPAAKLVSRKRSRETTAANVKVAQKAEEVPVIGKQSRLCTLYKFSLG